MAVLVMGLSQGLVASNYLWTSSTFNLIALKGSRKKIGLGAIKLSRLVRGDRSLCELLACSEVS